MIEEKKEEMIFSVQVKEEHMIDDIAIIKAKIEENEQKMLESAGTETEELKKYIEELNHDITDLERLLHKEVLEI